MDFRTKPISRAELRDKAKIIRKIFKCKNKCYFDVISAFELMPVYFSNVKTEIVLDEDSELNNIPATTIPDMNGNFTIKVKESVYEGAFFQKIGGYRNHIMHEICHVLLFMCGFSPFIDRTYKNLELKPFESIEWQAKALAGEILIPYENTKNMSVKQIMNWCKVSKDAALMRLKLEK